MDTLLLARRILTHYARMPVLIFGVVVQPVIFTILTVVVFGRAMTTTTGDYVQFLLPGTIVQSAIMSSMITAVSVAVDLEKGVMDRYRSLPVARGSILAARTLSDTVRSGFSTVIMAGVGYAMGFRLRGSLSDGLRAFALCLLVGYAFSWVAAAIGLLAKEPQAAQIGGLVWVMPLMFASSIFVPVEAMPHRLQPFVRASPITASVNAVRAYCLGLPPGDAPWVAIAWAVGIVAFFAPVATWRFRRLA